MEHGTSSLVILLRQLDWNGALKRIESHPEEVSWVTYGETSLLTTCGCLSSGRGKKCPHACVHPIVRYVML